MDEAAKRRELQLLLLREGYSQDEARETAAHTDTDELDKWLERWRKNVTGPERQIVPPGTVDLVDLKSQRELAIMEAGEKQYYENRDRLAAMMAESFYLSAMPTAVLMAMIEVFEANGIERSEAIAEITKSLEFIRKVTEHDQAQIPQEEKD